MKIVNKKTLTEDIRDFLDERLDVVNITDAVCGYRETSNDEYYMKYETENGYFVISVGECIIDE